MLVRVLLAHKTLRSPSRGDASDESKTRAAKKAASPRSPLSFKIPEGQLPENVTAEMFKEHAVALLSLL